MIKIFGQVRYHWQPELSVSLIYWSIAFIPIFTGLALMYESSSVPFLVLSLIFGFLVLLALGVHRYFTIREDGVLKVISSLPFMVRSIEIANIAKLAVNKTSVAFHFKDGSKKRIFYMRKWPKKYFINDLALHPSFDGEVELTDHLIELDYFEVYYGD